MSSCNEQRLSGGSWRQNVGTLVVISRPLTGQVMYVQRNIEALSCSHCCGKAIIITYSERVFVTMFSFVATLSHKRHH